MQARKQNTPPRELRGLLDRSRAGDREAFGRLADLHRPDLVSFVKSRLGLALRERLEPDDIAQETLLRAFGGLDRFKWQGPESFRRWLFAIAENLIRNASRKRTLGGLGALSVNLPSDETSPSQGLRREERLDRLRQSLKDLSDDHRLVIELARIDGLKIAEIAERMGRSPNAVKKLLARALDELKEQFGETASFSLPRPDRDPQERREG